MALGAHRLSATLATSLRSILHTAIGLTPRSSFRSSVRGAPMNHLASSSGPFHFKNVYVSAASAGTRAFSDRASGQPTKSLGWSEDRPEPPPAEAVGKFRVAVSTSSGDTVRLSHCGGVSLCGSRSTVPSTSGVVCECLSMSDERTRSL